MLYMVMIIPPFRVLHLKKKKPSSPLTLGCISVFSPLTRNKGGPFQAYVVPGLVENRPVKNGVNLKSLQR